MCGGLYIKISITYNLVSFCFKMREACKKIALNSNEEISDNTVGLTEFELAIFMNNGSHV